MTDGACWSRIGSRHFVIILFIGDFIYVLSTAAVILYLIHIMAHDYYTFSVDWLF